MNFQAITGNRVQILQYYIHITIKPNESTVIKNLIATFTVIPLLLSEPTKHKLSSENLVAK